jgi:hypothetical protein
LPGRRLSDRRLDHVAHDYVFDLGRIEVRALDGCTNRLAAEGRGGEAGDRSPEPSEGRAGGAEDDGFGLHNASVIPDVRGADLDRNRR